MEAYKSKCPDCNEVYFWTGYKTGIGKTQAQLDKMKRDQTVCKHCGSENLKTGLDHETEDGRAQDELYGFAAASLFSFLGRKE